MPKQPLLTVAAVISEIFAVVNFFGDNQSNHSGFRVFLHIRTVLCIDNLAPNRLSSAG